MKKKRLISLLFLILFLVGCAESTSVPSLSVPSASTFVPQPQSSTSVSVVSEPEQSLTISSGVDVTFLYGDVTEISSSTAADTKQSSLIEATDENVCYIFSRGNTYGIKQRDLVTGAEIVLFQTNEHEIYSFIRIDDAHLLFESRKNLSSYPNDVAFPRSFLYMYDTQNQQLQSLTEQYGLEKYSKGGTAFLENGEEFMWEGPSGTFYAYSNGYIYMDTYDDSLLRQGGHFVLRIALDDAVEKLPVEMNPASGWISVNGSFVYIVAWDEKTLYAVHESSTTARPLLSWMGSVFLASVNDGYLYLDSPENDNSNSTLTQDNLPLDYSVYHRIDLSNKSLAGQTMQIDHDYTDGTSPYGSYLDNSPVYETVHPITKDVYQKSAYIFEPYPKDGSGKSECIGAEVYQYTWDGQMLSHFTDFENPSHSFGFLIHEGTLYYLDSFGGDTVLKTMQPSA